MIVWMQWRYYSVPPLIKRFVMISDVISRIKQQLNATYISVSSWFAANDCLMDYTPSTSGWTIRQNLEHITLTNYYLLKLVTKATGKALQKAGKINYALVPDGYDVDWERMEAIGKHGSFTWIRPQHMEPTGLVPLIIIAIRLTTQVAEVEDCLNRLSNGEGALYKTTMSVNGLGKLDVYHYVWFLVLHMQRHVSQMHKIKLEFDQL
jgi:hypothetical protein